MGKALKFVLMAVGSTLMVGLTGTVIAAPAAAPAVWLGAGLALVIQSMLVLILFVLVFAGQPLLAHGLGMIARFVAFGLVAMIEVPMLGVPAAPFLFSLVAVFFVTTLLEPVLLFSPSSAS